MYNYNNLLKLIDTIHLQNINTVVVIKFAKHFKYQNIKKANYTMQLLHRGI